MVGTNIQSRNRHLWLLPILILVVVLATGCRSQETVGADSPGSSRQGEVIGRRSTTTLAILAPPTSPPRRTTPTTSTTQVPRSTTTTLPPASTQEIAAWASTNEIEVGAIGQLFGFATSGLPVTFELYEGPCIVAGDQFLLFSQGTCTVAATQSGNAQWSPAGPVGVTIEAALPPSEQLIHPASIYGSWLNHVYYDQSVGLYYDPQVGAHFSTDARYALIHYDGVIYDFVTGLTYDPMIGWHNRAARSGQPGCVVSDIAEFSFCVG